MNQNDTPFQMQDIPASLGLLSRLPVRVNPEWAMERGARAAWAYPVAGAVVGALAGLAASLAIMLGFTASTAAIVALATLAGVTGALHQDGLADTFDGLWGGHTPERRLEIMKDSSIGAYGVLALILITLAQWSSLTDLIEAGYVFWVLIGIGAVSRVPMVVLMNVMPNARTGGLAAKQGLPGNNAVLGAIGVGGVLGLFTFGGALFWAAAVMSLTVWLLARSAQKSIGGQTGDILGASQQLSKTVLLMILAAGV